MKQDIINVCEICAMECNKNNECVHCQEKIEAQEKIQEVMDRFKKTKFFSVHVEKVVERRKPTTLGFNKGPKKGKTKHR